MSTPDSTLIFIVDDDPMYVKAVEHILRAMNYENIKIFHDGESCIDNMSLNPEIILLDYQLGDKNLTGLDVLIKVKSINPGTQVVFLTANENIEIATNTIKKGAYDYVVKSETAAERIKNVVKRICFENQIKSENKLLKNGRRVVLVLIVLMALALLGLSFLKII